MIDCSKVVPKKCQGDCCHFVPIPNSVWEDNKEKVVRKVYFIYRHDENNIMPITKDLSCPFMNEDFKCVIYNARPWVCRTYGIGGHKCLSCPYLKPDGSKRGKEERIKMIKENESNLNEIVKNINKVGKLINEGKSIEEITKLFPVPKDDEKDREKVLKALIDRGAIQINRVIENGPKIEDISVGTIKKS